MRHDCWSALVAKVDCDVKQSFPVLIVSFVCLLSVFSEDTSVVYHAHSHILYYRYSDFLNRCQRLMQLLIHRVYLLSL